MNSTKNRFTHPTMAALAGALGLPVHILRAAKKDGALGFASNGNVDALRLLAWTLTKGQNFTPEISLESARARLASVRARQIENEDNREQGIMLPGVFVHAAVHEAFAAGGADWIESRLNHLSWLLCSVARLDDETEAQAEVMHQLKEDAAALRLIVAGIKTKIQNTLKAGPSPGEIETDRAATERLFRETCEQLTPPAKAELLKAIESVFTFTDSKQTNTTKNKK